MFSIILPVYNAEETIEETLQSIKNQDYTDYELVIINDGSNDNTLELIFS
jgi:glycosyltransferase involved in cell wall biosynthesis